MNEFYKSFILNACPTVKEKQPTQMIGKQQQKLKFAKMMQAIVCQLKLWDEHNKLISLLIKQHRNRKKI